MIRPLHTFHGGLHLPGHKSESTGTPVVDAGIPKELILPVQQHIGEPAEPVVAVGDKVKTGQMIARPQGFVSAPVHASSSGMVTAIEERPVPHPSGLNALCVVIETDGEDTPAERTPVEDYESMDPSALRNVVREAGIVGLGGAGFPSFIKLNPGPRTAVDMLILNGSECEPYITCDDMLMREQADQVISGARVMAHALQAREVVIAVEDNKQEAYMALLDALRRSAVEGIELVLVPTLYPTGGEKQLIKILTGREVPSQGLPIDIGIVCHNVATAASVHRAVFKAEPLISRLVTVTGSGAREPKNLQVRLGSPIDWVLEQASGCTPQTDRLVVGGPMMGFALRDRAVPVIKTVNCLLCTSEAETRERGPVLPCIRCGACSEVCPASLLPQQLYWYSRAKDFDKVQDYNLFDCIECGCCAYVCPSNLPLVQYYRFSKTEIWAQEREKKKADLARQRHEFRQERIEREKAERAARMAQKKAALKDKESGEGAAKGDQAKKDAIKAAMERAKAKKAASGVQPANVDNLTEEQQRKLAEAKARRAEKQTAAGEKPADAGELTEEQKRKLAEAKARRAQKQATGGDKPAGAGELTEEQKRKLAEAKARRAQKQAAAGEQSAGADELTEEQKRKLAEAKARRAQKQAAAGEQSAGADELTEEQKRKLAEAKARRAQKQAAAGEKPGGADELTEEQKRKLAEAKARRAEKAGNPGSAEASAPEQSNEQK